MGHVKRKSTFKHAQKMQIWINLQMHYINISQVFALHSYIL